MDNNCINTKMESIPSSEITPTDIVESFFFTFKSDLIYFHENYTKEDISRIYYYMSYPFAAAYFMCLMIKQWHKWLIKLQSN